MPDPADSPTTSARDQLAREIAAGKTISLSDAQWADPNIRAQLPHWLQELAGDQSRGHAKLCGHEVLGEIGSGGMSSVYLARNVTLGRLVALKLVHGGSMGGMRNRERLLREARAMAALTHPGIVAVYEVIDTGDAVGLAMEWVDGLTLAQVIEKLPKTEGRGDLALIHAALGSSPVSDRDASATSWVTRVMRDVALAVQHVHAAGMLHLDIKPSNVLIRRNGSALLADFGVVRELDVLLTQTQSFAGTPIYAAPEQFARHRPKFTAATDVYGLGITLYEALARTRPLDAASFATMLHNIEVGKVPPLASRCRVPPDLENIVNRAIHPDPAKRYASAADFAADLTAFLEHRPVSARKPTFVEHVQRFVRAEPWKAAAALLAVLAVPIIGALSYQAVRDYPKVLAATRTAQLEQAMSKLHSAVQARYAPGPTHGSAAEWCAQAYALLPEQPLVLSAHAAAVADRDFAAANALLQHHANVVAESAFLRALQVRIQQRRCCFTETEFAQLATSHEPNDLLALCMDQVRWERWRRDGLGVENGTDLLERARLFSRRASPLTLGMLAASHAASGHAEQARAFLDSLRAGEGDTFETWRWIVLVQRLRGPQEELAAAKELRARFPLEPTAIDRLFAALCHNDQWDQAKLLLEAAELAPEQRLKLQFMLTADKHLPGDAAPLARELLASGHLDHDEAALKLFENLQLQESEALVEQALQADVPDPMLVFGLLQLRGNQPTHACLDAAAERCLAAMPPLGVRVGLLSIWRDPQALATARDWLGDCGGYQRLTPVALARLVRLLALRRRWQDLVKCGEECLAQAADDPALRRTTLGYLAIAYARLGDDVGYERCAKEHFAGGRAQGHFALFVERAQRQLQAGPSQQAAAALSQCAQLARMVEQNHADMPPWLAIVRAEAELANGNLPSAKEWAAQGRETLLALAAGKALALPKDHWAAPDDLLSRAEAVLAR